MPSPVPLAPPVTVIQALLLVAVHEQLVPVTTLMPLLEMPVEGADTLVGVRLEAQLLAACVTVKVIPAIVIVPARPVVPGFAATLNVTVPSPVPLAPPVTVIQASLLVAVQEQLVPVTTDTDRPVLPVEGTDVLVEPRL